MADGAPLDWEGAVWPASFEGRLMTLLSTLPRQRWKDCDPGGWTLLHHACVGDNLAAAVALLAHGVEANARCGARWCALHFATASGQHRTAQVLYAAGATLVVRDDQGNTPLDFALRNLPLTESCVQFLLANGVRLSSALEAYQSRITPELQAFERGVLHCRAVVVAMLRVKRAGGQQLARWDRFLLAVLARDIWLTRSDKTWSRLA